MSEEHTGGGTATKTQEAAPVVETKKERKARQKAEKKRIKEEAKQEKAKKKKRLEPER